MPLLRELAPCILSLGSKVQHGVRDIQETQLLVIYACFSKWQGIRVDIKTHIEHTVFGVAIFLFAVRGESEGQGRNEGMKTSKEKEPRHKKTSEITLKKGGKEPFGRVGSTAGCNPEPRVQI